MISHYLPRLMEPVHGFGVPLFRAFCGATVPAGSHQDEPSCNRCHALLEADVVGQVKLREQYALTEAPCR